MRSLGGTLTFVVAFVAFVGCGGSTSGDTSDAAGATDATKDDVTVTDSADAATVKDVARDTSDAPTDGAIDRSCGVSVCGETELCFHGLYQGLDGDCIALPDGGTCDPGWTPRTTCHGPNPGCIPPKCTPFATCSTPPAECSAAPSCSCFATDPCAPVGHCVDVTDGHVHCVCNG
jgi:hypothetical protein